MLPLALSLLFRSLVFPGLLSPVLLPVNDQLSPVMLYIEKEPRKERKCRQQQKDASRLMIRYKHYV